MSGQAVSIINAANNYVIKSSAAAFRQRPTAAWGQGGHSKLPQPSLSLQGMRSRPEQCACIALHAAHDSAQEDMRRFDRCARLDKNGHQHCSAGRVAHGECHPTQPTCGPQKAIQHTDCRQQTGTTALPAGTALAEAFPTASAQPAGCGTSRRPQHASAGRRACCRAGAQRYRNDAHEHDEEELRVDVQRARRGRCGSRSRSLDLLAARRPHRKSWPLC